MYAQKFLMFFGYVVLSMQANPDDCIKGKQYLSKAVVESGECVACPPNSQNCYDQPYEEQQRCVDWCRVPDKPPKTESTKPPLAATSTEIIRKFPKATVSPSGPRVPVVAEDKGNEDEPEKDVDAGKSSHERVWLFVAVSVSSLFAVTSVISVVLLVRAWRRSTRLNRGEVRRDEEEENFPLHEMPPANDEEGRRLQPNDEEERRLPANADEEQRLVQTENGVEPNRRRQNHEELGLEPAETYLHWRSVNVEEHVARQETQPPIERCTPSSTIAGTQEEGNLSSLNIQIEIEN